MKTSKITEVVETKNWDGPNGTIIYHQLKMENGDKIEIGKKTNLNVGDEIHYEIKDTSQEYNKSKSVNPEWKDKPIGGGSFKGKSNNASFALSYAKDIFVAHGALGTTTGMTPDDVTLYITGMADDFLKWLNENQ